MRPSRLLRTQSFRLTLLYVALFSTSVLVLFAVIHWTTVGVIGQQMDAALEAELGELESFHRAQGVIALVTEIAKRTEAPSKREFHYLLQDRHAKAMAGDLPAMAPAVGWQSLANLKIQSAQTEAPEDSDDQNYRALGGVLADGGFLLVAQSTERLEELDELISNAFGWALAVTAALAILGGAIMSRSLLRRVDAVNTAIRQIMAGDLSRRIPVRGTADEFDRFSASLNEMLARMESLMNGLRQVSNDIAHDLRSPLSRLRQRLETMQLKAKSVADYRHAMDEALGDVDAILDTFGALLRIAQIEAGTRRAGFTAVDLSGVFTTIMDAYAPVAEDQGHRLIGEVAGGIHVQGDRELLTQMLANLVENALRHTPAGTEIQVLLAANTSGPLATIADSGPGIPERERSKVFQRFYRLDASRTTPGSGLGLSLVAAVADLHEIAIELRDNRPGLKVEMRFP